MQRLSAKLLTVFVAATLAGACLHFFYDFVPNPAVALIAPVNESIWEHLKIIYWPFLAGALVLCRRNGRDCLGPWLLALLAVCAAMLAAGYLYHVAAGGGSLAFDIGLYVLLVGAGFLLPAAFERPAVRQRTDLLLLLTAAMGGAMVLFTFLPPDHVLFADLSGVNTWQVIPY